MEVTHNIANSAPLNHAEHSVILWNLTSEIGGTARVLESGRASCPAVPDSMGSLRCDGQRRS
jgi:hypothetical protein